MLLWPHKGIRASRRARARLAGIEPAEVRSVAVIKHAGFGDLVQSRPFVTTLRKAFPNAQLTFGAIANYMNGVPEELVDRVHVAVGHTRPRASTPARLRSYRELGYHDLLFDITASSTSSWITALNPARVKIGFRHHPLAPLIYDVTAPRAFMKLEAECFLDLLAILRVRYDWPLDYGWPPAVRATDPPYILYFPSAAVPDRCWPPERTGQLMARLAAALPGYRHTLLYGLGEWELRAGDEALAVAGAAPNIASVRDATGDDLHSTVRGATMIVCHDTGVRNLAIARGVATLGIFRVSTPDTYLPRFGHHEAVFEGARDDWPSVEAAAERALRLVERVEQAEPER